MGIYLEDAKLDSVLENYFEEGIKDKLTEFLKSLIVAKEDIKKEENVKQLSLNARKEMDNKFDELIKELKKNYQKMKSTSDFKKKCKDASAEYNDAYGDVPDMRVSPNYIPRVNISEFEGLDRDGNDGIIEIITDEQEICIFYDFIIHDLANSVKDSFGKYFNFGFGDGDEGCLYVFVSKEYFEELLKIE